MKTTTAIPTQPANEPFFNLVGDLQEDIKAFVKKEVDLAKAEMREKASKMGRNAIFLAAGGVAALFAAMLLFLGLGALVAWGLERAGLSIAMSYFVSYFGLALILGGVGAGLIFKAKAAFSKVSLAPEKAMSTLGHREASHTREIKVESPKQDSSEIQHEVEITRSRLDAEMAELKHRLTPGYMVRSTLAGLKHHPMRAILIGAGTGLGSYLLLRQKHGHIPAKVQAHKNAFGAMNSFLKQSFKHRHGWLSNLRRSAR